MKKYLTVGSASFAIQPTRPIASIEDVSKTAKYLIDETLNSTIAHLKQTFGNSLSVLLIVVSALYLLPFGTQVYGSAESTNQCDLLTNRSCPQTSNTSQNTLSINSETEAETTQTPLILPDLSPTREDLNDDQTGDNAKSMDFNENDAASATDDNTVADNSNDEQETENNGEPEDNDGEEDTGDGPSIIPFP